MKKALILIFAALMIPSVALAAKPSHPGKPAPQVTYVLKGTLSNYMAYDSVTPANGSITIVVKRAMPHGKSLKGATLTFPIDAKTKIKLRHHMTTITDGDRGIIMVRAAKHIAPADLAATLQASSAKRIVDQGAPKPKH